MPNTVARSQPLDAPRRRRRHFWIAALTWVYVAFIVALWPTMRELGDRSWLGALVLFAPRWPYAVPLIVLAPLVLLTRRWWSATALLGASAVLLFPVMGFRVALPSGDERADLRVLTCNIHRQHLDPARLLAYLDEVRPDVVALQGWSDMHRDSLFQDASWQVLRDGELLLASRHPIRRVEVLDLKTDDDVTHGEQGAAALYEVKASTGTLHVINLHLASPHAGLNSMWRDGGRALTNNIQRRRREVERVRSLGDRVPGPLLFAGDFNTATESPIFRECSQGLTDAFLSRGTGLGLTYFNDHTQIRIDHILGDASIEFTRCWVGPDVNAAHRPVVADVKFR